MVTIFLMLNFGYYRISRPLISKSVRRMIILWRLQSSYIWSLCVLRVLRFTQNQAIYVENIPNFWTTSNPIGWLISSIWFPRLMQETRFISAVKLKSLLRYDVWGDFECRKILLLTSDLCVVCPLDCWHWILWFASSWRLFVFSSMI